MYFDEFNYIRNINGLTGRDIGGCALAVYGSRTSVIIYNALKKNLEEWTLRFNEQDENIVHWERTNSNMKVAN